MTIEELEKENKILNEKYELLMEQFKTYQYWYREEKEKNRFLMKRESKLQLIEQMFQNGPVDLSKLSKLVKEQ